MSPARAFGVVLASLALLLGATACGGQSTASSDRLPAVTLSGLRAGESAVNLGRLHGPAVVNLWANYCAPCRQELPVYESFSKRFPAVKVLGVDWNDPARSQALALAKQSGVTYPLVADPTPHIRSQVLPRLILVGRDGRIVHSEYVQITSVRQLAGLVHRYLGVHL